MEQHKRLKALRVKLELTQQQMATLLELKQGSYSDIERGKAGFSSSFLKGLITHFKVNPIWLCEGDGAMFLDHIEEIEKAELAEAGSHPDKHIVSVLEKEYRKELDEHIALLEKQHQEIENLKSMVDFLLTK